MVRIIKKLLKQIGYENVDEASNGEEALAKIKGKSYGLIISDWNMEPMTGFELLKHVRADATTAKTPFILVTAELKPENVLAAHAGRRQQLSGEAVQRAGAEGEDRQRACRRLARWSDASRMYRRPAVSAPLVFPCRAR